MEKTNFPPFFNRLHDDNATEQVGVSSKVLGATVHNDICSPLEWILEWWRTEGGVNGEFASNSMDLNR